VKKRKTGGEPRELQVEVAGRLMKVLNELRGIRRSSARRGKAGERLEWEGRKKADEPLERRESRRKL
jgi:hypothetical protein